MEALNAVRTHRLGSASRKGLMHVLADYAAADWSTYVGQARLAAETELGERTVRRLLDQFEREGLIRRLRQPARGRRSGGRHQDHIVLVSQAIRRLPASVAAHSQRPPAPRSAATGAQVSGHATAARVEPTVNLTEPRRTSARRGRPEKIGDVLKGLGLAVPR